MSRTPASYSMQVVRGGTWEDEFTYTDEDGNAIDRQLAAKMTNDLSTVAPSISTFTEA